MAALTGRIAVVAGATRGVGRGIARALGEAGATVYCTGRSIPGCPSPYGRPETIDETAELVTGAGGTGIAIQVDHGVEAEVQALFARVDREQGRLDILADSVAGMDPGLSGWSLWDTDLARGDIALRQALLSHVITAKHAIPVMAKRKGGLIVEVTEGDTLGAGGNVLTVLAKASLKTLALVLAQDLRKKRIAVVSITPGFLRSEMMLEHFKVTEANWRDAGARDPSFLHSETPLFIGRAIAALAQDPRLLRYSGQLLSSWELARVYGVTDADGSRPDWGRHAEQIFHTIPGFAAALEREAEWLEQLAARARRYGSRSESAATTEA